jgi:hypothetical protein
VNPRLTRLIGATAATLRHAGTCPEARAELAHTLASLRKALEADARGDMVRRAYHLEAAEMHCGFASAKPAPGGAR